VACPRDPGRGEIFDKHQFDLAHRLEAYEWVKTARDKEELRAAIEYFKKNRIGPDAFSGSGIKNVIEGIKKCIQTT
jgi:UDP-N-acetylglucosamine transferase subunit ALG13